MAMFLCLEVREITSYKDDCIWKTKILGHRWFEYGKLPECNITFQIEDKDCIYSSTNTDYVGKSKPLDTI